MENEFNNIKKITQTFSHEIVEFKTAVQTGV